MSNDIDYVPKDRKLCEKCLYYEICPLDYVCPTLNNLIKFEMESGEL